MALSLCSGHEQQDEWISRVSTEPLPSAPTTERRLNEEENYVDYTPCIKQQTDGARLQYKLRLMMKEIIALRKRHLDEYQYWSEKWTHSLVDHASAFEVYGTTRQMFTAVSSVGDDIAEQLHHSIEELQKICQSIPKEDPYPSVKYNLQHAYEVHPHVNRADHSLAELKKKRIQLEDRLIRIQHELNKLPLGKSGRNELETRQRDVEQKIGQSERDIKIRKEAIKEANRNYRNDTAAIFYQNQECELARLRSLQGYSRAFVQALEIKSPFVHQAIQSHNPEKDLSQWRRKYAFQPIEDLPV